MFNKAFINALDIGYKPLVLIISHSRLQIIHSQNPLVIKLLTCFTAVLRDDFSKVTLIDELTAFIATLMPE